MVGTTAATTAHFIFIKPYILQVQFHFFNANNGLYFAIRSALTVEPVCSTATVTSGRPLGSIPTELSQRTAACPQWYARHRLRWNDFR